jgi:hypothetical protein
VLHSTGFPALVARNPIREQKRTCCGIIACALDTRTAIKGMLSYWKFIVTGFLLTVSTAGTYVYLKREDFKNYISQLYKRELKIGDNLASLHFPKEYHATGVLHLVTSNISEPFEIWYSQQKMKSRIDYYQGKFSFL